MLCFCSKLVNGMMQLYYKQLSMFSYHVRHSLSFPAVSRPIMALHLAQRILWSLANGKTDKDKRNV
jgi:hypothetical protein